MLLQYKCSNFHSIKDKIHFSMRKVSDEPSSNKVMRFGNTDIERFAAIYGANGSGKTNFILSINFAKNMVMNSVHFKPSQGINIPKHKLSRKDEPSTFDFQFTADDVRYAYGFSVVEGKIDEEYLYCFPYGKKDMVFERKGLSVNSGKRHKRWLYLVEKELQDNRLFLSCAANYSMSEESIRAYMFFKRELVVCKMGLDALKASANSVALVRDNPQMKAKFLAALDWLGTGIKDVRFEQEKLSKVVYPEFESDVSSEEGTGTQRILQAICSLFDILNNNKVVLCDGIENCLHRAIVKQIIELFYLLKPESEAQLIFSSHDTSLLSKNIFRKGQIWLTEMKLRHCTDLYSLAELKGVRNGENFERGYIEGKYGAIPLLKNISLQL